MSNQNENDKKILELKNKIQEKKDALKKAKKFSPTTNCSLNFPQNDKIYNLNALDTEDCTRLLVILNAYRLSAVDLGIAGQVIISNYPVENWIEDLKARLENLSVKNEQTKLQALEKKLEQLLSEDKRTQLELDNIENLLK